MLNGYKPKAKVGGDFDPIPMGVYTCQVVDVNPVTQFNKFKGEDQEMMNYQFAILDEVKDEKGQSIRGRFVWLRCSMVFSSKSWLGKFTKGLFGRELTDEEKTNFDFESVVGKQVKCVIQPKPNADGSAIFSNIISFDKVTTPLTPVEFKPKDNTVVKSGSTPVSAPADEDPEKLIKKLDAEAAKNSGSNPVSDAVKK